MGTLTQVGAEAWMHGQLAEARRVQEAIEALTPLLTEIALRMAEGLRAGHKVLFFGNGGSAADAQHWAAELSGRFYQNRPSLPALALTTNTSQLTAVANDFGFDEVFARPLAALGRAGDLVVAISTSGKSANVCNALSVARDKGLTTIGFMGQEGSPMEAWCDYGVVIPSDDVARVQEGHELCAHLILAVVERVLFGDKNRG